MSNPPVTKSEAIRKIQYNARIHALHCRFYRRLQKALTFFSLLAGAAALVPVWQSVPGGLALTGAVLACVSAMNTVGGFGAKAIHHELWMKQANDLVARSAGLDIETLDAQRVAIPVDNVTIEALRGVAWNDVLESNGFENKMRPETLAQRFWRAIA